MKYRAVVGLTVPVNEAEDARIRAASRTGKPIPHDERRTVRVEAGEVADYIPELSIPWLLDQRLIEEVADEPEE